MISRFLRSCLIVFYASAVCAAAALPSLAESPAQTQNLTPLRAMEIALERHPRLLEQRERRNEFRALKGQALSRALPKVSANASAVRTRNPGLLNSPNFASLVDGGDGGGGELPGFDPSFLIPIPVTTYDYNISVEQTVYAFGRVGAAINAARIMQEQIDAEIRTVEIDIARDAVISLYGLAVAQASVKVLAAERGSLERQVQQAKDFLEIGTGTRLQYLQAKTALTRLRPREIEAQGKVEVARIRLNEALGLASHQGMNPVEGILNESVLKDLPSQQFLLEATGQRPDLLAMQTQRRSIDEQSKVWRADTLPDITFTGAYGIQTIFTEELVNREFSNWYVGLTLGWTFYDGKKTAHKIAELRSQQVQNEYREKTLRAQHERDLVSSITEYKRAREFGKAALEGVVEAEETQRIAEENYRWGAATSLDILQAQQAVTDARFQALQAAHDALVAYAQIHALTGLLPLEQFKEGQQ